MAVCAIVWRNRGAPDRASQAVTVDGQGLDQFGAEWYVVAPSGDKIDE